MNSKISKYFIIIANQFGKRRKKWKNYKLFSQTQFYPTEKLKDFQNSRLQSLLREAIENVPYYSSLFSSLKLDASKISLNNLNKIPFLTKAIIAKEKEQLLNKKINPRRVIPNSTSGSSGTKTLFYSDKDSEDLVRSPLNWRSKKWIDLDIGNKELRIWGARFDVIQNSELPVKIRNFFRNRVVLSSYKLNPDIIKEYIKFIAEYKPEQIHAYPSSIYEISKFLVENNITPFKPKAILTSGEQLYEWQRSIIKKAFGTGVYNFYGCREVGIIGLECRNRKGLHVMTENIILEVVNKNGENVYDEEGEIVVTDLSNYVAPFIRYKILDRGILTKEKCGCGRNLPLLKSVTGRTFDLIRLSSGGSIGATFFTHLFREEPGIKDFRIYQDSLNEIQVDYIPEDDSDNIPRFKKKIEEQSENLLNVKFNKVDQFVTPDSGKKQFIFSKV